MTAAERETVIQFDDASETATVYTCHAKWQRHFRRLGLQPVQTSHGGETFEMPRAWIKLPRKTRRAGLNKGGFRSKTAAVAAPEDGNSPSQGVGLKESA